MSPPSSVDAATGPETVVQAAAPAPAPKDSADPCHAHSKDFLDVGQLLLPVSLYIHTWCCCWFLCSVLPRYTALNIIFRALWSLSVRLIW